MSVAEVLGPIGNLADHARIYATQDLDVFPVNPRDKTPLVSQYQATTDTTQIDQWWHRWPGALIGHRLPPDQIILDIDPRHGGHTTWQALRDTCQIPQTRRHQSGRGDGGGHTWWQHPGGHLTTTRLDQWAHDHQTGHQTGSRWTSGIDLLRHDHRYTILPPSPHPDTGQPYHWAARHGIDTPPAQLPDLLIELLTDTHPDTTKLTPPPPDPDSILDWYSHNHTWNQLLEPHGWTLIAGNGDEDRSRWRHPTATAAYSATIRHHCLFIHSPNTPFTPTTPGDPHGYTLARATALLNHNNNLTELAREAHRLRGDPQPDSINLHTLAGTTTIPTPLNLPDTFWDARPALTAIRQAAWSRSRSADAVLAAALTRAICTVTPTTTLPPIVGSRASLNLAVALIGPSGGGKSSAAAIATELIPLDQRKDIMDGLPVGSGEGLIDAYFEWVTEEGDDGKNRKVKRQTKTAVHAYIDEGQALTTASSRQGSTILPTIRSAWSGTTLGQANASEERKRILPAHTYRLGIVAGFQPEHAHTLIDDAAGGTPQRFIFLAATDPRIPDTPPDWPDWDWQPPPSTLTPTDIDVATDITATIRADSLAQARGTVTTHELDSHRNLLRLKTATALSILDGRLDTSDEDWALAGLLLDTSDAVRADIITRAARRAASQEQAATTRLVHREAALEDGRHVRAVDRMARKIAHHVHRNAGTEHGPRNKTDCTRRCANYATSARDRADASIDEAIEAAVTKGWIVVTGRVFSPGESVPK